MPRAPRDTAAGFFHVTAHGVRDAALFPDDLDRVRFLTELARATARTGWTCIGFCLMRTHYHLLLEVDDGALPRGMHSLNFRYACAFNSRHRSRGHVLERRYYAGRIESGEHLVSAYRYVVQNPVVAGACRSAAEWPWSSYRAAVGGADEFTFVDPTPVLAELAGITELAISQLRELVES